MFACRQQALIRATSTMVARRCVVSKVPVHPAVRETEQPLRAHVVNPVMSDVKADPLAVLPGGPFKEIDTRQYYQVAAADDPVQDYQVLAKMAIWDDLVKGKEECRVLDTCAGTGRWAQAFSELVVKDGRVTCDFEDLCADSTAVLAQRQDGMANLGRGEVFTGDLCTLGELGVPSFAYDCVVNMHGLYGIPSSKLHLALQSMYDALKPGGTMVIAIGHESSPYQRVPKEIFGMAYTGEADILQALDALDIQRNVSYTTYKEEFSDPEAMRDFLMNECGGNTFPTDVAKGVVDNAMTTIKAYADEHFDASTGTYRFPQKTTVITVHRDAALLPEMQLSLGRKDADNL